MSQAIDPPAAVESSPLVIPDVPPAPTSTLGQTPHEPKVRPWELELLISGALVFSLLQMPGQVDAWYNHLAPGLDGAFALAARFSWLYVKVALYAITGGFVLHLAIRAYWVGVIGLEAVYPGGIVWEKSRSGPIMRDIQRRATPSLQSLIDGADRLASLVFAGGFILAMVFAFSMLLVASVSLLAYGVAGVALDGVAQGVALDALLILLFGPLFVATFVDRRYGDRLNPTGRTARVVRAVSKSASGVMRYTLFQPLLLTILTNLKSQRRGAVLFVLLAMAGLTLAGKDKIFPGRGLSDGYTFLPDDAGRMGVEPRYYEDKRAEGETVTTVPSIQSDMVRDPYVRLFIPYRPRLHNLLVARRCARGSAAGSLASAPRPATEGGQAAVLRCLAALQPVTLNGRPVSAPFRFYTQPATGVRGIAAYIPVAGLPKGENVLRIAPLPEPNPAPGAKPPSPFVIPFWL
ncbi:MAG TPA: hypothetical protein VGO40_20020 [Longimicrobium sp.]|jgi:hypothetical protein|nr:hypothetical protein [Longimicrobium sp.]